MDALQLMIEEGDDGLGCSLPEVSEAGTFVHLLKASEKKMNTHGHTVYKQQSSILALLIQYFSYVTALIFSSITKTTLLDHVQLYPFCL